MLEAQVAILFHRAPDDFIELGIQVRIKKPWCDGFAVENGLEDNAGSVAAEGKNAGGHFVQNYAKGSGDKALSTTIAFVDKFRKEFEDHLDGKPCPYAVQPQEALANA